MSSGSWGGAWAGCCWCCCWGAGLAAGATDAWIGDLLGSVGASRWVAGWGVWVCLLPSIPFDLVLIHFWVVMCAWELRVGLVWGRLMRHRVLQTDNRFDTWAWILRH